MDNEMIERVAIACFKKLCPGIRYTEEDRIFYKEAQIEAIKTMREPTEKMKNAAWELSISRNTEDIWQVMIDAIVSDETYGSNFNPIIEADL